MHRRKRTIIKSLVLGFVVAAFAAPAALAEPRGPGNPPQVDAATPAASPDDRTMYRGTSTQLDPSIVGSPDDRAMYRGISPQLDPQIVGSPDDRALFRGTETPNVVPVNVTVSSPSSGFQWDDGALGAFSTLALVLLMGAATLAVRHQRRRLATY